VNVATAGGTDAAVEDERASARHHEPWFVGAVVAAFVVSRMLYYWVAGVHFDMYQLHLADALLDPSLLRHDLFRSLWYLHVQPPGFNLLVGGVLQLSPFGDRFSLQVVFQIVGVFLIVGLYDVARRLGLNQWTALVVAVVIGCSPGTLMYENGLSYDYLAAALVIWVVAFTIRWVATGRLRALVGLVAVATATVLVRALFHPLWLVVVVVLALLMRRPNRWTWRHIVTLAVPFALVGGLMVKNEVLFGTPQLSSLLGFNMWRVAVAALPPGTAADLRKDGTITAPLQPPRCKLQYPGVPALADEQKPTAIGGVHPRNANWECFLPYYARLQHDAIRVIEKKPFAVAKNIAGSFELWAYPSSLFPSDNIKELRTADAVYRRTVLLDVVWTPPVALPVDRPATTKRYHLSITIVLGTLAVIGAGVVVLAQWSLRRRAISPVRAGMLMGAFCVAFVTFASTVLEHGENPRLRFPAEPLTLLLTAVIAITAVRALLASRTDHVGLEARSARAIL